MKRILQSAFSVIFPLLISAQTIQWTDVSSNYEFPPGLKLFEGSVPGSANFQAWYYEVDMNVPTIGVRPYLSATSLPVHTFAENVGAYGAVNGGFFSASASVSSVVYPGQVLARNLTSVTRFGKTYPLIRPIFAINKDRSAAAEWVYHHSYAFDDIYIYEEPLQYGFEDPNPLPVPLKADGTQYENIAYALGGAPMLVKNGEVNFTWNEEIMWGSGVDLNVNRPRTAVGYTADNKIIIFVTNSMRVENLPGVMLSLGCHGAINLDGGGSSSISVGGESLYYQNRPVPTILAIVHADSMAIPKVPTFEKFIDTGDSGVTSNGNWFATSNDGFFGSPSMLHALASDDEFFEFPLHLPGPGEYEVYGWWTAHPNRAADTPYYITHGQETTRVEMNQSIGGSMWNLVGTFHFEATEGENIRITAAATTNSFVVADAIRVVSYDPEHAVNVIGSVQGVDDISVPFGTSLSDALALLPENTLLTDTQGNSYTVVLSWEIPGYDPEIAGDYSATGSFELPDGVGQTTPPTPLQTEATVTVLPADDTSVFEAENLDFTIFPNPGNGLFTLEGSLAGNHNLRVYSLDGKLVFATQLSGRFYSEIDLTYLRQGIYIVRLSGAAANHAQKIIIR